MVFSGLEKLTGHTSARTQSWKFTVPYSCCQLLDNPALYPPGWTNQAYFAPRGDRNKRHKESAGSGAAAPAVDHGGGEALLREDGETEQQRQDRLVEEQVVLRLAEARAAGAAAAMEQSLA